MPFDELKKRHPKEIGRLLRRIKPEHSNLKWGYYSYDEIGDELAGWDPIATPHGVDFTRMDEEQFVAFHSKNICFRVAVRSGGRFVARDEFIIRNLKEAERRYRVEYQRREFIQKKVSTRRGALTQKQKADLLRELKADPARGFRLV